MKEGIPQAVRDAGGAIFAVTSEPQTLASEARVGWELDFPTVGDPHHEIADACRERGWLDLYVNTDVGALERSTGFASHPKGFFQPGVIALTSAGRVLYRWRGRPGRHNAGGASHRPLPDSVWKGIRESLERGDAAGDAALDSPTEFDFKAPPWPVFVTLLLANGKFLRPEPFPLARGGPADINQRSLRAIRNLVLFLAGWVAAFALLPTALVLMLLAGWAIYVAPGLVEVHRHFQNVPAD